MFLKVLLLRFASNKEDIMYKLVKIPIGGGNSHLNESGVTPA